MTNPYIRVTPPAADRLREGCANLGAALDRLADYAAERRTAHGFVDLRAVLTAVEGTLRQLSGQAGALSGRETP